MGISLHDRWNAISLRTKITGVTVLLLTFGLLISGIGTLALLKPALIAQLDSQLETVSYDLSSVLDVSSTTNNSSTPTDYYYAVYAADGTLVQENWADKPDSVQPQLSSGLTLQDAVNLDGVVFGVKSGNGRILYHAVALPVNFSDGSGAMGTVLVALSTASVDRLLTTYMSIFLGFGIGVVILGALLTRFLVTTTFAPLREVEQTAAAIAGGDFSQRLPWSTPNTEVGRLNRALNTMLGRIDRAFTDRSRTIEQMRRFVGDASHELRTPLVSVRGYAELYRMGALQTPEEVGQAMERIEKEAIRMGALVEDLLELARLDETRDLELTAVNLSSIVDDASMDARAFDPEREVTVIDLPSVLLFDDGAPAPEPIPTAVSGEGAPAVSSATGPIALAGSALSRLRRRPVTSPLDTDEVAAEIASAADLVEAESSDIVIQAEEGKVRQVITNLMGNALRFTPSGTPLEIGVGVASSGEAVVAVVDHGEGIPPQVREKIFERFWRADNSRTRETGGTGLGLAIVAGIVAAHHGHISVTETPGGGATFRVFLPITQSVRSAQA